MTQETIGVVQRRRSDRMKGGETLVASPPMGVFPGPHEGAEPSAEPLRTGSTAPRISDHMSIEAAIGVQVRLLRKKHDMTVMELAKQTGLSIGMLSKIENGTTSPSLSTLQVLAQALNVPITSFFSQFEAQHDITHVVAGQGLTIERRGTKAGHRYQLLGQPMRGDFVFEPYLITMSEDAQPYAAFQHAGTELIYMLSGEVVYRHGDKSYHLRPGDSIFFDAEARHGPEELLVLPMQFLSIIVYPGER